MRVVGPAIVLIASLLWGCAATVPADHPQSLVGVWQGVITGREMANTGGVAADDITLTVSADGTWTATTRGQRWTGTSRVADGEFVLDGTVGPGGRAVWLLLRRYGDRGLGGRIGTEYLGHTIVTSVQFQRTS